MLEKGVIEEVKDFNQDHGFFLPHSGVWKKDKLRVVFDGSATDKNGVSLNSTLETGPNLLKLLVDVLLRFRKWKEKLPDAVQSKLLESTYMDDIIGSLPEKEEVTALLSTVRESLQSVGINLKPAKGEKVLGVRYSRAEDQFEMNLDLELPSRYTQRNLLRTISSIFDPLGLMSPYVIRGKMLLQDAWREEAGWDGELSSDLQAKWRSWIRDGRDITAVFPRWLNLEPGRRETLHVFCDASNKAYAACAYAVTEDRGESTHDG